MAMRSHARWTTAGLLVAFAATAAAGAADFAGSFHGDKLNVQLTPDHAGGFTGTAATASASLPLTGRPDADGTLKGTFASGQQTFEFTATLAGDRMTFATGTATYQLTRVQANPLDAAGGDAPVAAGGDAKAGDDDAVTGPLELLRTDHGRALLIPEADAASADAALDAAFPVLPRLVGGSVTARDRIQDTKHPGCGQAPFRATVDGRPVNGAAFAAKSAAGGYDVSVVYAAADAPADECKSLLAALPHPEPQLKPYNFPDGSGFIGVPDGWQCKTRSALDEIDVTGPQGQVVSLGTNWVFNGPNSAIVQSYLMGLQVAQRGRSMGMNMPLPPEPDVLLGRLTDPVTALQEMDKQTAVVEQRHGRPRSFQLNAVQCTCPAAPGLPNGQAVMAVVDFTQLSGPGVTAPQHRRMLCRLETVPMGNNLDNFTLYTDQLSTTPERFERDLPLLAAIYKSRTENAAKCAELTGQRLNAQARIININNKGIMDRAKIQRDAQDDRFNRIEGSIKAQNVASYRASADEAEFLSGQQKVLDSRTGNTGFLGYDNSDADIQAMNDATLDPGRFKAIHRRDEQYPLP